MEALQSEEDKAVVSYLQVLAMVLRLM